MKLKCICAACRQPRKELQFRNTKYYTSSISGLLIVFSVSRDTKVQEKCRNWHRARRKGPDLWAVSV